MNLYIRLWKKLIFCLTGIFLRVIIIIIIIMIIIIIIIIVIIIIIIIIVIIIIIIIILLRSRPLKKFLHEQWGYIARLLHINADRLLYPLAAFGCKICSLFFATVVSFCHELEHRDCMSYVVCHVASWGCAQGNAVGAVYNVQWGAGCSIRHLMNYCIAYTIKTHDV